MKIEITLDAIRTIVAEEIHRFAEEQAAAKAARPKQRVELTAEEAAQYMTVEEVSAVTGYTVGSLRSMGSKGFTPAAFPILPVRVGLRSLYVRDDVMATPKAQQFPDTSAAPIANGANQMAGFVATPKTLPPTQTIDVTPEPAGALGAMIQNAISAAVKKPAAKKATVKAPAPAAKKAAPTKQIAPAAKKAPAVKPAPAAKKAPAKRKAA
ncbi:hypothetical protein [Paraburkholderia terrae]|nr:hypothetical protein [Paraburkholderia terrae]